MRTLPMFASRKLTELRSWLRAVVNRDQLESNMEAELRDHLERRTEDLIRAGHSRAEAARRARIELGPALVHKESMRASLGLRLWDELAADLRYAIRLLRKSSAFTFIAAGSLALAIGANTAIFSVAKQVLFDRLSVPHPEELRLLRWTGGPKLAIHSYWGDFDTSPGGGMRTTIFSYPAYTQLRASNRVLEDIFAFTEDSMNATIRGTARRVNAAMVSGNYFAGLEVLPQLGRTIQPSDDAVPGAGSVAVISDGIWQREFGGSPSVLGQTIKLNQITLTIVGVAPKGFTGAKSVMQGPDVFVPLSLQPAIDPKGKTSLLADPNLWWLSVMGRRKEGIDDRSAQAGLQVALEAAVRSTMTIKAGDTLPQLELADGNRGLHFADLIFKKPLTVLMIFTGIVILLACANVANLLLARGAQRQREMSVRLAVGGRRMRILRQLLTESLMLACLGGVCGLALGYAGRNVIPALLIDSSTNIPFDWSVFCFSAGVTLLTGVLFGLAPALAAMRAEPSAVLKQTAATVSSRRKGLSGKMIVSFQVALSMLLVIGAGLFLRTLLKLNSVDVGFNADNLLIFEINPPNARYGPGKDVKLFEKLEQGISAVPGVENVSLSWYPYMADNMSNQDFFPEGDPKGTDHGQAEDVNVVGDAFFQTMGIPIVSGRSFGPHDTETSPKVGIINEALARKRFPNTNPVGKRFQTDGDKGDWIQIVGISRDTHITNLRDNPPPQFFMPYVQEKEVGGMVFLVRSRMKAAQLTPALRRVVQSVDPDLPMIDVRTQREQIEAITSMERMFAALSTGFGVLALALACVGIYGVMAYSVAQRTNEIGIRMALGAQRSQVRRLVLRESVWVTAAGIAAGGAAALLLTRLLKSMLYGIQPWDPATISAAMLLLLSVALVASWIPARRASCVQPMEALRHE